MRPLRLAIAPALLLCALALAACGSSSDSSGDGERATSADGRFPVTVATAEGSQTIPARPERIVALDFPSADALLALGANPIAIARVGYVPGGIQDWTKAALGARTPKLLETEPDIPLERIAALRPDLIVAADSYNLGPVQDELEQLAPLITYRHGAGVDTWQQSTRLIGEALGREPAARRLIERTEARVRRARRAHPALEDKTVTLFNYYGGTAWAISDPDDFSISFLESLGLRLAPEIERREGKQGRLKVSSERLGLLDADIVLGTTSDPSASLDALVDSDLFQALPAVRRGAYASLEIGPATSIAFPSALSIDYALDRLVPLLDRLARAD